MLSDNSTSHTQSLSSSLRQPDHSLTASGKTVEFRSHMSDKGNIDNKGKEATEKVKVPSMGSGSHGNSDGVPNSEYYRQLCTTFSKAMAHYSYVAICRLLGQYYLKDCLCNADLVEQLAYSHDEMTQPYSPLTTIFTDAISLDADTTSDSSDEEEEEEEEEEEDEVTVARDAALKVGPIVAVTGLNMEVAGFRKSSWFVTLEEHEIEEAVDVNVSE